MNAYDRFVKELREPVSRTQIERSTARVLERLEAGEPARLVVATAPIQPLQRPWEWSAITAFALAMIVACVLQLALVQPVSSDVLARTLNGRSYRHGERILARSDAMNLLLEDGSRIEMSAHAGLSIDRTADGMRIVLSEGHLIVTAAKQHGGHLYVETKDCEVSVVGTVFSVHAGPSGSRVSVVEGEVRVRQGEKVQTLLPGQQVSTDVVAAPVSVKADIAWSSQASELVALLQQSTPGVLAVAPENQPGTVRGRVLREGTGEGIADVMVTICPDPEPTRISTIGGVSSVVFMQAFSRDSRCTTSVTNTDGAGRFVVRDLSTGRYVVQARKSGFTPPLESSLVTAPVATTTSGNEIIIPVVRPMRNLEIWTSDGAPVVAIQHVFVDTEPRAAEVMIGLVGAAKLSGKVRNSEGNFAPYVPVQLGVVTRTAGIPAFRKLAAVNTNGSGEYRFRVPPGDYLISAGSFPAKADGSQEFPMPGDVLRISVREGEEVAAAVLVYRESSPWR